MLKKDTLLKVDERFIEAMSGLLDTNNPAGRDDRTRIQRNSMTDTSEGGGIQEYQGAFKLICEEVYPNPENPEEKKYILGVVNGQHYEAWRVQENDLESGSWIPYNHFIKCNGKPSVMPLKQMKPFYITINKLPEDTTFAAYFSFYYSSIVFNKDKIDEPTLIIVERDDFRGFISKDGFSATLLGYFHWDSKEETFTIEQIFGVNVNEFNVSMPEENFTCVNRTEFRNPKDLKDKTTIYKIAVTNYLYSCFKNTGGGSDLSINFSWECKLPYWESPELPLGKDLFLVVVKFRTSWQDNADEPSYELAIITLEEASKIGRRKATVEEDGSFTVSGFVVIASVIIDNGVLVINNSYDSELRNVGSIIIYDMVP